VKNNSYFFISYTQADQPWAVWIAWVLEAADYKVTIQEWDLPAGKNWVTEINSRIQDENTRLIAVLSKNYSNSRYGGAEWQAVWSTGGRRQ
jgi:hypothetical protein